MILPVNKIKSLLHDNVIRWHEKITLVETEEPWNFIEENAHWNFLLWHEEDIARIKDIDPLRIVEAKRNIDTYNQKRNNSMEKIDEWVLQILDSRDIKKGDRIHSETPGMIIDRLAIMSLKRYHMFEETQRTDVDTEHIEKCRNKVMVLDEQIEDLSRALEYIFHELESSNLQFKVYRQFKMYNDPSLNPELYKRK